MASHITYPHYGDIMSLYARFRVGLSLFWQILKGVDAHCVVTPQGLTKVASHAESFNQYRSFKGKTPVALLSIHIPKVG